MWQQIFDAAMSNGLWAVLFLCLLVYVLRDSRRRELKYRGIIDTLLDRLEVVEAVKEDTGVIRGALEEAA